MLHRRFQGIALHESTVALFTFRRKEHVSKSVKKEEHAKTSIDVGDVSLVEESVEVGHEKRAEKVENMIAEGKSEEKKGVTDSEVKNLGGKEFESCRKKVEDENSPVVHYWKDEECQPLVHPGDSTSLGMYTALRG